MRFDCVAGETGEPGEALQSQVGAATSAAKFLFFSFFFFPGIDWGQQVDGRWQRQRDGGGVEGGEER